VGIAPYGGTVDDAVLTVSPSQRGKRRLLPR